MQTREIQNLIKELVEKTTVTVNNIEITKDGPSTWFSVEVSEPHLFTIREGEGLLALNHLVKKIFEDKMPEGDEEGGAAFLIDINSFQKKRVDNLRAIAHMMAERARYFKSNVEVDPMTAFERRVVHEFLSQAADLKTESTGFGPNRRVVIKYIGAI